MAVPCPGRLSNNRKKKGSDINKRQVVLTIAWSCEKCLWTNTRRSIVVARRLRTDRRSRRCYSTRISSSWRRGWSTSRRCFSAVNNRDRRRCRGETEKERERMRKKECAFVHLATYCDSRNAHFTRCTKRAVRNVPPLRSMHASRVWSCIVLVTGDRRYHLERSIVSAANVPQPSPPMTTTTSTTTSTSTTTIATARNHGSVGKGVVSSLIERVTNRAQRWR